MDSAWIYECRMNHIAIRLNIDEIFKKKYFIIYDYAIGVTLGKTIALCGVTGVTCIGNPSILQGYLVAFILSMSQYNSKDYD